MTLRHLSVQLHWAIDRRLTANIQEQKTRFFIDINLSFYKAFETPQKFTLLKIDYLRLVSAKVPKYHSNRT